MSTERIGGGDLLSLWLKRIKMTLTTPLWLLTHITTPLWPLTHITATFTSRWPEMGVVATGS